VVNVCCERSRDGVGGGILNSAGFEKLGGPQCINSIASGEGGGGFLFLTFLFSFSFFSVH